MPSRAVLPQSPLQVRLEEASVALNTVTGGLMWLRLVNTSMDRVSITRNAATAAAQRKKARSNAATAAAAGEGMEQDAATELLTAAREGLEGLKSFSEPDLCDMGAQQRALLQVVGPAAFDIYRYITVHLEPVPCGPVRTTSHVPYVCGFLPQCVSCLLWCACPVPCNFEAMGLGGV